MAKLLELIYMYKQVRMANHAPNDGGDGGGGGIIVSEDSASSRNIRV
jgi:hypothetical protein